MVIEATLLLEINVSMLDNDEELWAIEVTKVDSTELLAVATGKVTRELRTRAGVLNEVGDPGAEVLGETTVDRERLGVLWENLAKR